MKKFIKFLKNAVRELKLVDFPSRKETFKTGNIVILISVLSALSFYLIDLLFIVIRNFLTSINL